MPVWVWVVYALSTARLTGLITRDTIFDTPREALLERLEEPPRSGVRSAVADLITCPWCSSIYMAAAVAPLAYWHGTNPWVLIPAFVLAMSQVTGMLSNLGRG